ncbi:MAG: penicillin-binding protein [bacterium]
MKRVFAIAAFLALCFGILICRAVAFHLKDNAAIENVALRQYRTAVRESSMRGKILDAAGREMAIDVTADSIFANPREIKGAVEASGKLAQALHVDRAQLLDRLSSQRKFVWVKRRVSTAESEAIKGLNIEGIYAMRESKRSYPNGSVGASVLGAVGFDNEPLGGVELRYDEVLAQHTQSQDMKRDARGHLYLSPNAEDGDAESKNIELTIDKTLQYIADRALAKGVTTAHARAGQAVVIDVRTGAVLAMSNIPTFDPNEYDRYPLASWRNSAIVEPREPGSTFKVIVVSAALDAGAVKSDDTFNCEGGSIKIGTNIVRDSHAHGKLSVADIIRVSSNIGAYKVEQQLGQERVEKAIKSFGFGKETGIDLPGEAAGLLSPRSKWSPIQFATIAFGQGIAVTPLQMSVAFAAIANGGNLMKPYVVKRITNDKGLVLFETTPQVVSQPIGEAAAKVMNGLLRRVTQEGGTGTLAASLEYQMAGKTGTAQKVDSRTGRYAEGRYYASFVGFAPADSPRIAVFVGIDEPRGAYYGGQVAAPLFRTIVEESLHYLKVPSTLVTTAQALPTSAAVEELAVVASEESKADPVVQHSDGTWRLPDLTGLTMRGVLAAAKDAAIDWEFKGSGVAVNQSPSPGSAVDAGTRCTVEFKPMM